MALIKDLHQLIHSLSKYEKSQLSLHFKTFAGKSRERYLNDFKCFSTQKNFDDEKLKKKLNKIEKRKNLSESNNNLYQFILNALIAINQKKSIVVELLKAVETVELLYDKGLMTQAHALLKKTKQKCEDSGQINLLLELLEREKTIVMNNSGKSDFHTEQIRLTNAQIQNTKNLNFIYEFKKIYIEFFQLGNKVGSPRNQAQKDKYIALTKNKILETNPDEISKDLLKGFYIVKFSLYSMVYPNDVERMLDTIKEGLEKIRENFNKKVNITPEFVLTRADLEVVVLTMHDELFDEKMNAFMNLEPYMKTVGGKALFTSKKHWAYLHYFINIKAIDKAYEYILENKESILSKHTEKFSPQAYTNFMACARICFLANKYEESLEFIELLLDRKDSIRKSLHSHIHCLNLLNLYHLKSNDYLPYAIRSFYRSILASGSVYEPEKALLNFLKRSINTLNLKKEMQKLYNQLLPLSESEFHAPFFALGDYLLWLEREINS